MVQYWFFSWLGRSSLGFHQTPNLGHSLFSANSIRHATIVIFQMQLFCKNKFVIRMASLGTERKKRKRRLSKKVSNWTRRNEKIWWLESLFGSLVKGARLPEVIFWCCSPLMIVSHNFRAAHVGVVYEFHSYKPFSSNYCQTIDGLFPSLAGHKNLSFYFFHLPKNPFKSFWYSEFSFSFHTCLWSRAGPWALLHLKKNCPQSIENWHGIPIIITGWPTNAKRN